MDDPEIPPLEDDRVAMRNALWDAIRTNGESLKYHYEDPSAQPQEDT